MTEQEIQTAVHRGDVHALDAEITRLVDQLSDCWLVLDQLARMPVGRLVPNPLHQLGVRWLVEAAQNVLRHQQVPGWKGDGRPVAAPRSQRREGTPGAGLPTPETSS
jgi:hypothetical protein